MLGVSERTIDLLVDSGALPSPIRVTPDGKAQRYLSTEAEAFLVARIEASRPGGVPLPRIPAIPRGPKAGRTTPVAKTTKRSEKLEV